MQREIKFRGKRVDGGGWVYGYLLEKWGSVDRVFAIDTCENLAADGFESQGVFIVDHKTVGQYTGLKDKNGKEIYEGDILRLEETPILAVVKWGKCGWNSKTTFKSVGPHLVVRQRWGDDMWQFSNEPYYEIIGNIHETPELLEDR